MSDYYRYYIIIHQLFIFLGGEKVSGPCESCRLLVGWYCNVLFYDITTLLSTTGVQSSSSISQSCHNWDVECAIDNSEKRTTSELDTDGIQVIILFTYKLLLLTRGRGGK